MKTNAIVKSVMLLFVLVATACSDAVVIDQNASNITLYVSQNQAVVGETVTFSAFSNPSTNVTLQSVFYVNDIELPSNTYTFPTEGNYTIKAVYQNTPSNTIEINVVDPQTTVSQFVHRVLVEEYSGTWCGNCPRILYGTELLKQQTDKEVSVQIHLFGNDPFITSHGNTLAEEQNINGVPMGRINRTLTWSAPQYLNVSQVINEIESSSAVGLAINSSVTSGVVSMSVDLGFGNTALQTKLVVYVVEDNLFHSQSNYSSNLYGGSSVIQNFEYDGVLRSIVTPISGEPIVVSGEIITKNYSFNVPSNVSNPNNVKLVAFLIDTTNNSVLNVRQASLGETQILESL